MSWNDIKAKKTYRFNWKDIPVSESLDHFEIGQRERMQENSIASVNQWKFNGIREKVNKMPTPKRDRFLESMDFVPIREAVNPRIKDIKSIFEGDDNAKDEAAVLLLNDWYKMDDVKLESFKRIEDYLEFVKETLPDYINEKRAEGKNDEADLVDRAFNQSFTSIQQEEDERELNWKDINPSDIDYDMGPRMDSEIKSESLVRKMTGWKMGESNSRFFPDANELRRFNDYAPNQSRFEESLEFYNGRLNEFKKGDYVEYVQYGHEDEEPDPYKVIRRDRDNEGHVIYTIRKGKRIDTTKVIPSSTLRKYKPEKPRKKAKPNEDNIYKDYVESVRVGGRHFFEAAGWSQVDIDPQYVPVIGWVLEELAAHPENQSYEAFWQNIKAVGDKVVVNNYSKFRSAIMQKHMKRDLATFIDHICKEKGIDISTPSDTPVDEYGEITVNDLIAAKAGLDARKVYTVPTDMDLTPQMKAAFQAVVDWANGEKGKGYPYMAKVDRELVRAAKICKKIGFQKGFQYIKDELSDRKSPLFSEIKNL